MYVKDFLQWDVKLTAGDGDGERVTRRRRKKKNYARIVAPKLCHFAVVIARRFPWTWWWLCGGN
jgi:hypothetical protein